MHASSISVGCWLNQRRACSTKDRNHVGFLARIASPDATGLDPI